MSDHEAVLERIKKLLRLARSANRHEADIALQKALELAREYGVEVDQLDLDAQPRQTTHRDTEISARLSDDRRYASRLVGRFFRVRPIHCPCIRSVDGWPMHGIKISFVGTETDCEIALYVYGFLLHRFAWCWRHERGRCRNRRAFVYGMSHGIYAKLLESFPEEPAHQVKGSELALSHSGYIARVFGETESKTDRCERPDVGAAMQQGYVAGRKTEIHSAIKHTAPAPLTLRA